MSAKNIKSSFLAVFDHYEYTSDIFAKKVHVKNIRLNNGTLITTNYVFNPEIASKIIGHLTIGEYISFLANISASSEFEEIEFQYPHGNIETVLS